MMENNGHRGQENGEFAEDGVLLSGEFPLYPKSTTAFTIKLKRDAITWKDQNAKVAHSFSFKDIIGCDCMKGKTEDDSASYLTIYAYPHKKKFASKKTSRKRQTITIMFKSHTQLSENEKDSFLWWTVVKCLLKKVPISPSQGEFPYFLGLLCIFFVRVLIACSL
jgi:hypothetical protein